MLPEQILAAQRGILKEASVEAFCDELRKIAFKGRIGDAARRGAELLAGGKKTDVVKNVEPGLLGKLIGSKGKEVVVEGVGPRAGSLANVMSKDKALKNEALKVLGTRAAAGAAGTAAVSSGVKKHRKTERRQLGRAYVAGARDMYSRTRRQ